MDAYATLGLEPSADPEAVTAAYRALAKRWHPDHAGDGAEASRRMAAINAAYDALRHGPPPAPRAVQPMPPPAPPKRPVGHWLDDAIRRSLGRELLQALKEGEGVELVTPAATWKSPRAVLAVTDERLLWLLDDAISHRVRSLKWRDVVHVEHRARRPLRRTAVVRIETRLGRKLEWAELAPPTAEAVARAVAARAGLPV